MISVFKERFGVAEIRDDDSASAVLIHGLVEHDERIGREIAPAAGLVKRLNQGQINWFSFMQPGETNAQTLSSELSEGRRGSLLVFHFPLTIEEGKKPPSEIGR